MNAPLSGLVAKGSSPLQHTWVRAEQSDSRGKIIKLFVCTSCAQPHKRAYDLVDGIAGGSDG